LAIRGVYRKISAFIRSNWRDVRNDGFYFGPSAERRHLEDGIQAASFMPGTVDMIDVEVPSGH
jgi:hypothetical protein